MGGKGQPPAAADPGKGLVQASSRLGPGQRLAEPRPQPHHLPGSNVSLQPHGGDWGWLQTSDVGTGLAPGHPLSCCLRRQDFESSSSANAKKASVLQQSPPQRSSSWNETFREEGRGGGEPKPNRELLLITLSQQHKAIEKCDYTHKNLLAPTREAKLLWLSWGQKNTLARRTYAYTPPDKKA